MKFKKIRVEIYCLFVCVDCCFQPFVMKGNRKEAGVEGVFPTLAHFLPV